MPTPSLLIVPARFKSGKLYSQIPTSGAGDFTVTRATAATRVNASGFIEVQKTNLALQSSDYSLTWVTASLNSTSGVTSPSGTNDATLFEATTTTARLRQTITLTSGTTYTFSWFGKFGSLSSGFTMNVFDENATTYGSGVCQAFNLNEGTLGASGTVGAGFTMQSVGMENYGNGWYRCRMTVLMGYTPATPRVGMRLGTQLSGGRPVAVVSGTVNLWGAQLEEGSSASEYIPTTTVARTRFAGVTVDGTVATNIPRLDYFASGGTVGCPALLVEPSGTNGIRNNSMIGASVSGNTLPTNWILGGVGLVQQIVAVGTENGVSYIDLRLSGTATAGTATLSFESATQIAALTGQNWTISSYLKTIALPSPPTSFVLAITERTLGGVIVAQQTSSVSLTSNLARYSYSPTLNGGATTAFAQPRLFFTLVVGQAYDFTIRIGYPQMETGSVATSVIPTTTGSVTRNADLVSVSGAVSGSIGQTEGTMYAEFFVDFNNRNADILSLNAGNSDNGFFMSVRDNSVVQLIVRTATVNTLIFQRTGAFSIGVNKLAMAYKNGDFAICLNGTAVQTDTSNITMPSVSINRVSLGESALYVLNQQLRIRAAALYTTRLTNDQLAALTA